MMMGAIIREQSRVPRKVGISTSSCRRADLKNSQESFVGYSDPLREQTLRLSLLSLESRRALGLEFIQKAQEDHGIVNFFSRTVFLKKRFELASRRGHLDMQ